ncbi:MAG: alpha/beta hydrolase [Alistipes senegalensis]|nr:alpha/beta hydrolase [Bacteroides cellulosilyticus]MCM1351391.1 alpha/beta hydrolase [Alistipes senegalensis]
MKRTTLLLMALAMTFGASAQPENRPAKEPDHVLKIWDNATAPHSNGIETPEKRLAAGRVENVSEATLSIFKADPSNATGQAVVICPGGGYVRLAMEHEGFQMARWFAEHGIMAAVLKYRMPNGHWQVPLEDAEQALRIMAGLEAGATGFTADRVGIVGCSAGGHLAAMVSTMAATKPAFSILFYPVITGEAGRCHKGSFDHLLGTDRTEEQTARFSLQNRVTEATPPALLLLSDDDRSVPPISSTSYYDALKAHGIAASMHIYPSGGHGWGIRDDFPYRAEWQRAVLDWLKTLQR